MLIGVDPPETVASDQLIGCFGKEAGAYTKKVLSSLGVSQPKVSKIEGKEDIHLSTLHGYVEALGGHSEINAVFPDQTVINLTLPEGWKRQRAGRGSKKRTASSEPLA